MPRILVVDDEPLIAAMLREWLEELGCEAAGPVQSVSRALDLIAGVELDGAILDVSLGRENCYPVADALRERGIPFAFVTGYGSQGIDSRYQEAIVLAKPFRFEAVKKVVAQFRGE